MEPWKKAYVVALGFLIFAVIATYAAPGSMLQNAASVAAGVAAIMGTAGIIVNALKKKQDR